MVSPSLEKFLALIAFSEGTSTHPLTQNSGYDVIVTGIDGPEVFTDYTDHPFANRPPKLLRMPDIPANHSSAAGRYQLLYRYWKVYKVQLGLADYSPASQDTVALQQMKERHAVDMVLAGQIEAAIRACGPIWVSFGNNTSGQPSHPMDVLLAKYAEES